MFDHPSLNFAGNFSIDAWILTTNGAQAAIIDKRKNAGNTPVGYYLFVFGGKLGFEIGDGQPQLWHLSNAPVISDGQWHHVAVTVDRSSTTGGNLYVDGVQVHGFDPTTRPGSMTSGFALRIGQQWISATPFQGAIDEVEFFDRVLQPQEIQDIFGAGSAGKCKTPLPTFTPTPTFTRTSTSTATAAPTASSTATATPRNTATSTPTPSSTPTRTSTRTPTATPTSTATATATSTRVPPCLVPPQPMVGWWTADNTTNDFSGNGRNGHFFQPPGAYTAGIVGAAFTFSQATSDFVEVPNHPTLNFNGNFSLDAWIRTTNSGLVAVIDKPQRRHRAVRLLAFILHARLAWRRPGAAVACLTGRPHDGNWHRGVTVDHTSRRRRHFYVDSAAVHTFPTTRPGGRQSFPRTGSCGRTATAAFKARSTRSPLRASSPQEFKLLPGRVGGQTRCRRSRRHRPAPHADIDPHADQHADLDGTPVDIDPHRHGDGDRNAQRRRRQRHEHYLTRDGAANADTDAHQRASTASVTSAHRLARATPRNAAAHAVGDLHPLRRRVARRPAHRRRRNANHHRDCTDTATATVTRTATSTPTSTGTATTTSTRTGTATATVTRTTTSTATSSGTPTATSTRTSTATASTTRTPTSTPTSSATPTHSATAKPTQTPTPTATRTDTPTITRTPTSTATRTSTPTVTATVTGCPGAVCTATPSRTATRTVTPPCSAELCVSKFDDQDRDGVHDPGEPGLGGWVIHVTDAGMNVVATITTGAGGTFCSGVPAPGSYTVSEVAQAGWTQTYPPAPGTHAIGIDCNQLVNV